MNNKKIIFGILLFCAISFLAYTFANPLEKEEDEGKLVPGSNQIQNTGNDKDNNKDDEIDDPIKVDDQTDEEDPNGAIVVNPSDLNTNNSSTTTVTRPTSPSRPSSGNNSGSSSNNGGGSTTPTVPVVEVSGITMSITQNPTLVVGKTINLGASVSPSNATNKNLTYTSSNNNVVVVDGNGNVTAKGTGTATITITANNGKSESITITVLGNTVSKITALSTVDNTIITSAAQGNTSLALKGSVIEGTYHAMEVRIYVPKEYNMDLLKNLKYGITTNQDGYAYGMIIHENTYTGTNRINGDVSTGDAYVVLPLEFDDEVVEGRDGSLRIAVDWLGTGTSIIYSLDFSGVEIK